MGIIMKPLLISITFLAGFAVLEIEEWVSDKKSTGAKGKMENRARAEIPLFMTLICQKIS